jgi:hypothetical protein
MALAALALATSAAIACSKVTPAAAGAAAATVVAAVAVVVAAVAGPSRGGESAVASREWVQRDQRAASRLR